MANLKKKVAENAGGDFFVDTTCINCDTCRQLAPGIFGDQGDYAFVQKQPENPEEERKTCHALWCCPTGSIGTRKKDQLKSAKLDFPMTLEENVYYCGFNSPKSFGGNSYFVQHPEGNWLIDSPKFLPFLVDRMTAMGGLKWIFLSHRDDVADAQQFARHFGAQRIIHEDELEAQPDAEKIVQGKAPIPFSLQFTIIPTPGHTQGHCALLYKNRFLFTGDHLWWNPNKERLSSSKTYNWYSWEEQKKSLRSLRNFRFEWVLPGHGHRIHLPAQRMQKELSKWIAEAENC